MGAYLAKIQALDGKKPCKIQVDKIFHHIQPRHCTFRALLNCLKQLNNAQTCAKSHKDGQSHKNTGVRRAFFKKCSSRRANPSLDRRFGYTVSLLLHSSCFPKQGTCNTDYRARHFNCSWAPANNLKKQNLSSNHTGENPPNVCRAQILTFKLLMCSTINFHTQVKTFCLQAYSNHSGDLALSNICWL